MNGYRTIVADPPWQYRKSSTEGSTGKPHNLKRHVESGHYQTLTMRQIAALPVCEFAADNAHLYLWVTNPRLFGDRSDNSFNPSHIMQAWGFEYRTMLTWVKQGAPGMGNYFRINTEHVLFGVRGNCQMPPALREPNVFYAPKAGHSIKPASFLDLVERVSPGPYLEMFARRARFGWDFWGDESLNTAVVS